MAFEVVNCNDNTLSFNFIAEPGVVINPGDVLSLDLNPGDTIVIGDDNLCIGLFTFVHPDVNAGSPFTLSTTAVKQVNFYNGQPYYVITLTETEHGAPGLVLNYYFIWNNNRWEVWNAFNIITGPSNTLCNVNFPLAVLAPGITNPGTGCPLPLDSPFELCAYTTDLNTLGFDTSICESYITGIREVSYCIEPVFIGDFINCWLVEASIEDLPQYPILAVTEFYVDCDECFVEKNVPPCIRATDCATGTILYLTTTTLLESYIGSVVKIELGVLEKCYLIEVSEICPLEPSTLAGLIVDCYSDCVECIPQCNCTRARNNSNIARRLTYVDCNNEEQETTEIVGVGRLSRKYCVYRWLSEEIEIVSFGDCVDNACPEIPLPKRLVTPGYDTPICTPAQYERIVCRYAEIKYKEVLTKRYGIKDCCDDESLANDIKYELIHLQMLEDPEYVCVNNPRLCPPGCGYINMNIIHECPPEPEIYEYRLTIDGTPNPAAGSIISYTDENGATQLYTVVVFREAFEITFCAVYGSITINNAAYYADNEPCPTATCPAFAGLLLERIGDCPA